MSYPRFDLDTPHRQKQRGAAFIVMLVVLVMGGTALLVSSFGKATLQIERDKITVDALEQAREALLGRALNDDNRPGSLPCPDLVTDTRPANENNIPNDGVADWLAGNNCPSNIGRLPWKTLDLPDPRDGNNERLWYALSTNFRDDDSAQPLNSNTKGTLLVYGPDGASLQTQAGYSAVAVIFAPGSQIGAQVRGTDAEKNTAANYLDITNGRNNTSAAGPFIAGTRSDTFNDQLLFITTKDLMPLVEKRVAGEVKQALINYKTTNTYYPWADALPSGADNYAANDELNRGWLPRDAAAGGTPNWAVGSPPQWFFDNQWYALIYYSVAKNSTQDPGACTSCSASATLSVDGANGVEALFFMPGTPIGALIRDIESLPDYLEDAENKDDANDLYVTPTSQEGDRDRIYKLP